MTEKMHDNILILSLMSVYKQYSVPIHQLATFWAQYQIGVLNLIYIVYMNCHPVEPVYSHHLDLTVMLSCDEVSRKSHSRFVHVRVDDCVVTIEHFSV